MQEKYLYICDKQPGACDGWECGWKKCENEMCFHTSIIEHAKYKNEPIKKFEIVKRSDDTILLFEFCGVCPHDGMKCVYKLDALAGSGELCTAKENLPCEGLRH